MSSSLQRDEQEREHADDARAEQRISKPGLSRENHCGPLIAQKISRMIAKDAATGSSPLRQRAMKNASSR